MSEENKCVLCSVQCTPTWWTLVLMGIVSLILGGIAFAFTPMFIEISGIFIGLILIVYSLISIIQGIKTKEGAGASLAMVLLGIIGIVLGLLIVTNLLTAWFLITYIIAIWAFIMGFENIMMAFSGNAGTIYKVLMLIAGIIAVILGFYVLIYPGIGTLIVIQVLAIFSMVWGVFFIASGLAARGIEVSTADSKN